MTTVAVQDMSATFRGAMSRFATGVTLITTVGPNGPAGMTASAVSSVSLAPLMLLVCVGNTLTTRDAISESGAFAVSVLSRGQELDAFRFASRVDDKFGPTSWRDDYDIPVLEGAAAHFVCRTSEEIAGGDHTIFIGEVVSCGYTLDADPLVYFGSRFHNLCDPHSHARLAYEWELSFSY